MAERVVATAAALAALERLTAAHGTLMLFQSGGCCDGSSPICLPAGELAIGPNDLLLGEVGGAPFFVDAEQYRRWREPTFVLDVRPGEPGGFSLEGLAGVHFVTVSRPPADTTGPADDDRWEVTMTASILIAYASKHGSTREVAEVIGDVLEEQGLSADVKAVADIRGLDGYEGVVLGTALYMGRPHGDARRFLRRYYKELAALPVAVFAMGPTTTGADDVAGSEKQLEHALEKVSDIAPITTAIFGGVVKPDELHFPFNRMEPTDARDWPAIGTWAREVGLLLAERLPAGLAP